MKKILTLAAAVLFPIFCMGASSVPKTNTATVDVDKVTGNYNSFRWVWPGYSKQSCTFTFMQGSSYIDLTGYSGNFKVIKKTNAGQTAYISLTSSDITISGSNATFSVLYTNIPPDGEYMAEFWTYLTATPATARTLAQGKIVAIDSIYAHDDSSYPWPSNQDTFANYVLLTDDNYENAITGLTESAGAVFDLSSASRIGTLTYPSTIVTSLVGDTEFVIAGAGHSWTGSIGSAIARDSEVTTATGAVYTAAVTGGSNAAMAAVAATYLPLAGGTMTGALSLGSNYNLNLVYQMQLVNADPMNTSLGYGAIKWQGGSTYLSGNSLIAGTDAGKVAIGFSGSDVFTFCATNLNTGVADLIVGGAISEGGTALASKYAPKTVTHPVRLSASVACTNSFDWSILGLPDGGTVITQAIVYGTAGTGAWSIVQYPEHTSMAVIRTNISSATATASGTFSLTGDVWTGTATLTNGNIPLVYIPAGSSDYPTNTAVWRAWGYQSITY